MGNSFYEEVDNWGISIRVSDDQLQAYMSISEIENTDEKSSDDSINRKKINSATITDLLNKNNICYGIIPDAIADCLNSAEKEEFTLIAQGKYPTKGMDGQETFHFSYSSSDLRLTEREDGTVNFKELNRIENVRKGQRLYSWIEPTQGDEGVNIFGEKIEGIYGKAITVPQGENTTVDIENRCLMADMDGQVVYDLNRVCVLSLYTVNGDVDLSVGDIFFWGNVMVKGEVREGFKIIAEGDITIKGSVEGAQLRSGGNIFIENGINGMGTGKIVCEGDLYCKYIENCNITIKGNIHADAILHSKIECNGDITLKGRRSSLIGCDCLLGGIIEAKEIGSPKNGRLKIKYKPAHDCKSSEKIKNQIKEMTLAVDSNNRQIAFYKKLLDQKRLSPERIGQLKELINTNSEIQSNLQQLQELLNEQEEERKHISRLLIKCKGDVFEGVKIATEQINYEVEQKLPFCMIYDNNGTIDIKYGRA